MSNPSGPTHKLALRPEWRLQQCPGSGDGLVVCEYRRLEHLQTPKCANIARVPDLSGWLCHGHQDPTQMKSRLSKCFAGGHVARPIQQQAANDGCVIEALKQSGIGLLKFR